MDEWNNKDVAFTKKFLESETGRKIVEKVKAAEPSMEGDTLESRALSAAEFGQYRKDVQLIKALLEKQTETKPKDNYIDMSGLDVKE